MGQAIGQSLGFAVGVAVSPFPIIAVVLLLATPRGRLDGLAFLVGWIAGIAVVGTIVLLVASDASASDHGAPATWVSIVQLVLGVLLLGLGVKQWRGRPQGDAEAALPKWMQTIDTFTPVKSLGFAAVLSAGNPKNLILVTGGATAIAQTGASTGSQAVALAVFIVFASIGVGVPIVIYYVMGERAATILDGMRQWMARENTTIMAVLCLLIGVKFIGDAISALAS